MKSVITILITLAVIAGSAHAQENITLATQADSISYACGILFGYSMSQNKAELKQAINTGIAAKAIATAIAGETGLMTNEAAIVYFQNYMQAKTETEVPVNRRAEEEFLAAAAKKSGVVRTPSGLLYKVMRQGTGARPAAGSYVQIHYTGMLPNGAVFDSSVERGEKAVFPVNGLIAGFSEGLQMMTEGSRYIFHIPSGLAYGAKGSRPAIPPYTPLTFEVELFRVLPPKRESQQ